MKLNASALPIKSEVVDVHKLSSLVNAGQVIEVVEGSRYRVASKITDAGGTQFCLVSSAGNPVHVTANQLAAMGVLTPGLVRLAAALRFYAYNKDFNQYVTDAIEAHGLPVDPKMKWDKWFETAYAKPLRNYTRDTDLIDEAIHETIVDQLYNKDVLSRFNVKKFGPGVKKEPLGRQVSAFLSSVFYNNYNKAVRVIRGLTTVVPGKQDLGGFREQLDTPMEQSSPDEDVTNILDTEDFAQESFAPEIEAWEDISRFRKEFYDWLLTEEREDTADNILKLLNLIIEAEQEDITSTRADYLKKWMESTGKSIAYYKVIANKLESSLARFVHTHPEVVEASTLGRLIAEIGGKKPTMESKVEGKPVPVAASLHMATWPPFDFNQPDGDTGHLPHDNTGNTGDGVVVVDEKPEEQPRRTVAPEIPGVKHGTI